MHTNSLVTIDSTNLDHVTGGGGLGTAIKGGVSLAKKAGPVIKSGWDKLSKGADVVNAAQSVWDAGKSVYDGAKSWWNGSSGEKK